MGEYDDRRVEPHTVLVGKGMGVTPESIAQLEERQRLLEKSSTPKPNDSFLTVLSKKQSNNKKTTSSIKEKKRASLPSQGPRPGLVHPQQRETFGRDQNDDTVILKG
ncbi:MAG: hypothetical protein JW841_01405 [Deltaproteobacteria bacterium]|nr:hypothetical protein [Deltaproteobacteria bacterium]